MFPNVTEPYITTSLVPEQYLKAYLDILTAVFIISAILKNPWKYVSPILERCKEK